MLTIGLSGCTCVLTNIKTQLCNYSIQEFSSESKCKRLDLLVLALLVLALLVLALLVLVLLVLACISGFLYSEFFLIFSVVMIYTHFHPVFRLEVVFSSDNVLETCFPSLFSYFLSLQLFRKKKGSDKLL